jgi:DNA-binding NarL/FixJ family response regulator
MDNTIQILLIEDNPGDVLLMTIYLQQSALTYTLHVADTLKKGETILNQQIIDIVLLDLNLPDCYGFEAFTRFVTAFPNISVIVLSGMNDEKMSKQVIQKGASGYLLKGDFEIEELSKTIEQAYKSLK